MDIKISQDLLYEEQSDCKIINFVNSLELIVNEAEDDGFIFISEILSELLSEIHNYPLKIDANITSPLKSEDFIPSYKFFIDFAGQNNSKRQEILKIIEGNSA